MSVKVKFKIGEKKGITANYTVNNDNPIRTIFKINAASASFYSLTGSPYDNANLKDALDAKADKSELDADVEIINQTINENYTTLDNKIDIVQSDLSGNISTIENTINNYGDIVTYNASDFATYAQGQKADTALQPNDNISELVNDVGYITSASLPTVNNSSIVFQKNGTGFDTITLNQANNDTINITVPTQTSELTNNSGFITNAVNNLINYYLKSETYTKLEVQQLIASIPQFRVRVVQSLPETGERMVLYLVPKDGEAPDVYNEYIWVEEEEEFELLGSTSVDLSDYVTNSDLATALADYALTSDIPTDNSELTNGAGYITGINQADVIDALGYTPYNATNPNGYITSSALNGYATETYVSNGLATKQNTLTAGQNITINGDTISAVDTTYTAGTGISIENGVISNTQTSAEWGNIDGDITDQTDLIELLDGKQDLLTSDNAGTDIEIVNGAGGDDTISGNGSILLEKAVADGLNSVTVSGGIKRSLLPEGYTQYDYISVNGDCYFVTDYYPSNITEVKTKTFVYKQPTSPLVCRWTASPTNDTFGFYMGNVSGRLTVFYGRYGDTKYLNIENVKLNMEHDIYIGVNSITFDGTSYSITRNTFTSTQPIYIGAFNQTGSSIAGMMYGRIYPVEFIEGGRTVKHYIPCKNNNGVIGLYEAITGTFINPTSGTAKKGRPTITLDTIPDTYTRIEFLQSTGTQYIDSGVIANFANNKIEQTATVQYTTSNTSRELMGTNGYGFWGKNASNKIEAALGSVTVTDNALVKNVINWTTDPDGNKLTLNVNSNQYTSTASTFVNDNYAYYVFALGIRIGSGASASFLCHAKVWDYMIAVDNEVVCYLIPVKRNSDNVLGMYDVVTKTFKTNAGTGTFTAGSNTATPSPTNPIPIVTNNGQLKVSANLFDQSLFNTDVGSTITYHTFNIDNGTYTMSTDMPGVGSNSNADVFLFAGQVTSGASTGQNGVTANTPRTITVTNGKYTVAYRSRIQVEQINPKDYNWMLARSSSAQNYQPYGEVYAEGRTETITDSANNSATAEMLLSIGNYTDTQEILSGAVTRKVGVKVLDGTEDWGAYAANNGYRSYRVNNFLDADTRNGICTHLPYYNFSSSAMDRECVAIGSNKTTLYINLAGEERTVNDFKTWLAQQYAAGTPVMFIYPLATETTETVTGQTLTTITGDNTLTITQASIENLPISANYNVQGGTVINFIGTIPTVNNATITFTQGGTTKGTITLNQSSDATIALDAGGAVDSVNGQTGTVVLTASDVGALADTVTIPTKTSDLTNDSGFITGITSSDVTTALGYTPYNSTNPNGYITNSALADYVTNSSLSTTLADYVLSSSLASVATSGSYNDLINQPTIPTKTSDLTNDSDYATETYVDDNFQKVETVELGVDFTEAVQNANLGSTNRWTSLTYGANKFLSIGRDGYVSTSNNGTNWTAAVQDANLGANGWMDVTYDGEKFVSIGQLGYISTSTDGTTWATASQIANLGERGWCGINYYNNKYVALSYDGYISTSTNGTTWTTASLVSNLGANNWTALTYGNKYVAISYDGHISTSTDGTTWTSAVANANLGDNYWTSITYDGTQYIALGRYGHVSTSTDGTTWTNATYISNIGENNWYSILYHNSELYLTGTTGYVSTSASGTVLNDISNNNLIVQFEGGNAYSLIDNTGIIPDERISSNIARTSDIPSGVTVDQTYDGTSTNAQSGVAIAGAGFLTSHQSLANYVDLSSAQTITGTKTFNAIITNSIRSTSSDVYNSLINYYNHTVSVGNALSYVQLQGEQSRPQYRQVTSSPVDIALYSDIPTATSDLTNDSGYITGIASTDVTTALGYTPVNKSGDTMTGGLTVQNDDIIIQSQNAWSSTPSTQLECGVNFQNSNGDRLGYVNCVYTTDGSRLARLNTRNADGSANTYIQVGYNPQGNAYCTFPNTNCVDGQWVSVSTQIASDVSVNGSTNLTYTLSDVPNDGNKYEVLLTGQVYTSNSSGNQARIQVSSDIVSTVYICAAVTRASQSAIAFGSAVIPVGNRQITVARDTGWNGKFNLWIRGYRRIGSNS